MPELVAMIRRHESRRTSAAAAVPPLTISTAAVVGSGVMGAGIAQVLAVAGCQVRLHDVNEAALARGRDRITTGRFGLARGVDKARLTAAEAALAEARLSVTTDLAEACHEADLVIETVPEDLGLKVEIFRQLAALTAPRAILASNTSGYPIIALAGATHRPEYVLGWHWASPPPAMALAEIVVHAGTAPAVRDAVVALAQKCGKNPQVVQDQPTAWGFVANRVLMAVFREAEQIVAEGVATRDQVDALLRDCFRWPVGPFEMADGAAKGWE